MSVRTLVVWCPNWSLVAAGMAGVPSAVLRANRVVSCSPSARAEGVRPRQRRREAEAACYDLVFVPDDPVRDVRAFEPVVTAISQFTPRVEITRPGACSVPARGPARYFGGEESLVRQIAISVDRLLLDRNGPQCRIGVADTPFAARLAAQASPPAIVPAGGAESWLAGFPVASLGKPELADLLVRLGIRTLGDYGALDEGTVGARFGAEGAAAHRLARGLDEHDLTLCDPPPDLTVERQLDDPVDQVETVAFVAAGMAEELMGRLEPRGLACSRLLVEASTEHAEELSRWWRTDRPFTARAMVDRVRWQLEGWLTSDAADAPSAGITLVRLTAGEVLPDKGRQASLFGGPPEAGQRVERGIARIQGLLGHESIGTAVLAGGRGPLEQSLFVPWGEPREEPISTGHPWPGRVPSPSPALVFCDPLEIEVLDRSGEPVWVTGRGCLTAAPARLGLRTVRHHVRRGQAGSGGLGLAEAGVAGARGVGARGVGGAGDEIVGWAGPWPADERWWDPVEHRRRARLQVLLDGGSAYLLVLEKGCWRIEGSYD
ncbi:MAG: DNA polymerase Y family protein [Acidimicrobiales bacterium]